jgi:hypothetical protein
LKLLEYQLGPVAGYLGKWRQIRERAQSELLEKLE